MLSIIIPSYKDPLLQKTVDSLLENAEREIEIIPVLDGYLPDSPLKEDPRIKALCLEKNLGMRNAINSGVRAAKGEYIMKCDSHCMFGKGFDRLLLENIEDNWVVVPRLYRLDTDKWEVMKERPMDYQKFILEKKHNEFPIFRSGIGVDGNKKGKIIVYTLVKDKGKYNILLLRLINHKKWISILDNKKTFKALIDEIKHYQLQN